MRILLLIGFTLLPSAIFGQSINNFKYTGNEVQYEFVYNLDTDSTELQRRLSAFIPLIRGVKDVLVSEGQISGRIENAQVNYKAHGFKRGDLSLLMDDPVSYGFLVQIKGGKYRVVLSGIYFYDEVEKFTYYFTEYSYNSKTGAFKYLKESKTPSFMRNPIRNTMQMLAVHFHDTFALKPSNDNW
ncbi:MAG TPA: hypothetical protein VD907_06860 [Verrucomicrobiae bacterium]|nr:hypothetical protein [Verrucomicrobiae bacterium]